MKNILILVNLIGYVNATTILQDTVDALLNETMVLKKQIKSLNTRVGTLEIQHKDKIEILNTRSLLLKNQYKDNKKLKNIMIFTWYANVREYPSKESKIIGVYNIGAIYSIDMGYKNKYWYKLDNGYYVSKNVAKLINKDNLLKAYTISESSNIRISPIDRDKSLKFKVPQNTLIYVYPLKVANVWYVTKDQEFIYDKAVRVEP